MRNLHLVIWVIFLSSCLDTPSCLDTQTSTVTVDFRSLVDGTDKTITIDSIYLQNPVALIAKDIDLASAEIPMYPDVGNTLVVFQSSELEDSISLNYQVTPKLYAAQCDVELLFSAYSLDYTTADSVRLFLEEIPPRIEIFF